MNSPAAAFARLGMRLPMIQGPFGGGLSTVKLAATVSNAGGMGSYGAHLLEPEEIVRVTDAIRAETTGPFVMNLWVTREDPVSPTAAADFDDAVLALGPLYRKHGVEPPVFVESSPLSFERQAEAILRAGPPVFSFVFGIPAPEILAECRKRGIVTPTLKALEASDAPHLGYPLQGDLTGPLKTVGDGLFYSGQGAPLLRHHQAGELTRALAALSAPLASP